MSDPLTLALGGLTGLVFGFLLQKGGLTRFRVIVGQFLLRDFTIMKVMFTAMIVGGIGAMANLKVSNAEFRPRVRLATEQVRPSAGDRILKAQDSGHARP